jgi:hypothetical protein
MRATGLARSTIGRGLGELRAGQIQDVDRVRRPGGGRKPLSETDASLLDDLRSLVEPATRGDPQSPLLWTCKSLRKLAESLRGMGHKIGRTLVGELLHKLDYSLQANRKTREGSNHADRDAQFHYINDRVKEALASNEPAISVDTKKKELVGDFKNAGREWRPKGSPEAVRVHDFIIPELGRAVPYGVYDIAGDAGWVSVGVDHDTAAFAVNAIHKSTHQEVCVESIGLSLAASIRGGIVENEYGRPQDNLQVKPQRPFFNILEIVFNPLLHLLARVELAAQPVNLGPSGNSRFDTMAVGITADEFIEKLSFRPCVQGVRPRADDGHRALQDIEELRQLVDAHVANETANPGHTWVALARLFQRTRIGLFNVHRAEFPDLEDRSVEAGTFLAKEDRAAAFEFDRQGYAQHDRRKKG